VTSSRSRAASIRSQGSPWAGSSCGFRGGCGSARRSSPGSLVALEGARCTSPRASCSPSTPGASPAPPGCPSKRASSLGIAPWADRYPPIAASRTGPEARIVLDGWLISSILRYCPDCLAGDGRLIQREYGSPWQRIWHLPFTFACVQHRRFLRQGCPSRTQATDPVGSSSPRNDRRSRPWSRRGPGHRRRRASDPAHRTSR
jgi:hypothetical protein